MVEVAVVINPNKGIAHGILQVLCKKYEGVVYLTSTDETRGKAAVDKLNKLGLSPEYHQLDVADRDSVTRFRDYIKEKHGCVNLLVNNVEDNTVASYTEELLFPLISVPFFIIKNYNMIFNITKESEEIINLITRSTYRLQAIPNKNLKPEESVSLMSWLSMDEEGDFNFEDVADDGTVSVNRIVQTTAHLNSWEFTFTYEVLLTGERRLP